MKADISRQTFDATKHYSLVLKQQGRVDVDADWNEQQAINQHRVQTEARDVIGRAGAPLPAEGGGFAIGITADGKDLSVSPGRIYVDGILCESAPSEVPVVIASAAKLQVGRWLVDGREFAAGDWIEVVIPGQAPQILSIAAVDRSQWSLTFGAPIVGATVGDVARVRRQTTYQRQPDYFPAGALAAGRYAVYLDVWQRHITAIEDPAIREVALGGPDTATRAKVVWQVKLQLLAAAAPRDCSAFVAPDRTDAGSLNARVQPEAASSNPCILPPGAGYQRLENQLYRVEVHQGGQAGGAGVSFKWQRDNGSVVTAIEQLGQTVVVQDVGRDDVLGFDVNQLVEAIDDRGELNGEPGRLMTIVDISRATRSITLDQAPSGLDPIYHPKLRRWDGQGDLRPPASADDWISLEGGIQIQFTPGSYVPGDYWLIPARTATSATTGDIEWPRDDSRNSIPQPPIGVRHHYCALAIVDFDGNAFLDTVAAPLLDCRELFLSLTALEDAIGGLDHGPCTLVATPGPGWQSIFDKVRNGQPAQICFQAGEYPLDRAVPIANKGDLVLSGCGAGTRIHVAKAEAALSFQACKSVLVRDLSVQGGTPERPADRGHLNGALTFVDCPEVTVEGVHLSCAPAATRQSTCVTALASENSEGVVRSAMSVRVHRCKFEIGNGQVGLLVVNPARAQVEDNVLRVAAKPVRLAISSTVRDAAFRSRLRRALVSNAGVGAPPAGAPANVHLTSGSFSIHFSTPPQLVNLWPQLLTTLPPQRVTSSTDLIRHVRQLADGILRGQGVVRNVGLFKPWFDSLAASDRAVAAEGIVVGGRVAGEVRIRDNTIEDVVQGIRIGLSHREASAGRPDAAGRLIVAGNTIGVVLPVQTVRDRFGVFVGSCDTLLAEDNYVQVARSAAGRALRIEGMRIVGQLGPMAIVRHNHLTGVDVGVAINPLNPIPPTDRRQFQWLVADNAMPGAQAAVQVTGNNQSRVQRSNNIS